MERPRKETMTGTAAARLGLADLFDPRRRFDVRTRDVEYRRDGAESWLATVYQPDGPGPFPALLEIHGGAWNHNDRFQNAELDAALAARGLVVVAIDFHLGTQAPYPASIADLNYATRWLKTRAEEFNATAEALGALGYSSGGHMAMLSAMRPHDHRYAALPLGGGQGAEGSATHGQGDGTRGGNGRGVGARGIDSQHLSVSGAPGRRIDASLSYVIMGWPVLDPLARYRYARDLGRADLLDSHHRYFGDEATMDEANPQRILERGEAVELPPALIVQGADDDILSPRTAERFVEAYGRAGGTIELALYPGAGHGYARDPGPNTSRTLDTMASFIARQLTAIDRGW
ncbi:MAG: alpha/beta hydrolase [Chloroflexi bacterium]|nr:alpha/beta hydrolase [Chloroflexota bacterium]